MSYLNDCLARCTTLIEKGKNTDEVHECAKEIVSAFKPDIPNITHFRGSRVNGHGIYTVSDLKTIRGMLTNLQEKRAEESPTSQVDLFIEECGRLKDQCNSGTIDEDVIYAHIDTIIQAYGSEIPNIASGIGGYCYNSKRPLEDITNIQAILVAHKEKNAHERELAILNQGGINVTQQMSSQIEISISLESAIEIINDIPSTSLNDEDKTTLTGMLAQIEFSSKKGRGFAEKPIMDAFKWLGDKSFDVLVAAVPYIAKAITSL